MSKTNTRPSHGPAGGPGHGGPGRNLGVKGEKPKNFWGTVRRLFGYMSKRMVAIIAVFVLAIAAVIFQIQSFGESNYRNIQRCNGWRATDATRATSNKISDRF